MSYLTIKIVLQALTLARQGTLLRIGHESYASPKALVSPPPAHFCQPPFSTLALSNPKTRNSYQTRHAQYAFWAL